MAIKASISVLSDNDLLDLADIFSAELRGWLGEVAFAETSRRGISLWKTIESLAWSRHQVLTLHLP